MTLGYRAPLDIVAFDHRSSFSKGLFGASPPLAPEVFARISDTKEVIFEAFLEAIGRGAPRRRAGVLVDEQLGAEVARKAKAGGFLLAMPAERSGQAEFEFEFGDDFGRHIEAFDPDFSKVLVRYNPDGDRELNQRQTEKLARLSEWLHERGRKFLFELLVPATAAQLERAGDQAGYDRAQRPALVVRAMAELQAGGVEPDIWKIEGLESTADCARAVAQARSGDGRQDVPCIVLGRGASLERVLRWLAIAAPVPGFIGFAVGRTLWEDALKDYVAGTRSRAATRGAIADRYLQIVHAYAEDAGAVGATPTP
jgi:myo-inositol catabolism protein IolC